MTLNLKDRVKETTTTTGTGAVSLSGAVAGYVAFLDVYADGITNIPYCIAGGTEWEVGLGTFTLSGTTLSRDTVLASSNSGALVNFSAGGKDVFVTLPSARIGTLQGTPQTLSTQTYIDFDIPPGAKEVTVNFVGVSTSSNSQWLVQLGDSGGIENTGYMGDSTSGTTGASGNNYTDGFGIRTFSASAVVHGSMVLRLFNDATNTWVASGVFGRSDTLYWIVSAGSKSLSGMLTTVRITTQNGTDIFDAGMLNIQVKF